MRIETELKRIHTALLTLPSECRYHGVNFEFLGTQWDGDPRCDSCKAPARRARALLALDAVRAAMTERTAS